MIELVNGYVCRDCRDVALAKRNIDPAHPPKSPSDPTGGSDRVDANRPLADGNRGTLVNILV